MDSVPLIAEKGEIASLVREKAGIGEKLFAAGGEDFSFLLQDCSDLADIIDEIGDVVSKSGDKQHASLETKVKFSRKVRRKAKDLGIFEQRLVQEYDSKHLRLEHGRKMVEIIKMLRSKDVEKARRAAQPFYEFIEMGARHAEISSLLEKKRAQVERAKHAISAQLGDLAWLEAQAPVDLGKIGRHSERIRQLAALDMAKLQFIRHLQGLPLIALLEKAKEDNLGQFGFPSFAGQESAAMAAFLQKSGLETKSAAQLAELAGQSGQKLQHIGIDPSVFRKEIADGRRILSDILALQPSSFMENIAPGSPALAYLSSQSETAKSAEAALFGLGKTAEDDAREWERQGKIMGKRAALEGATKAGLEKTLWEMEWLECVLDGKPVPAQEQGDKKNKGVLGSLLGFLKGK